MFYEERLIDGVLMCRDNSDGAWRKCSLARVTEMVAELKEGAKEREEFSLSELRCERLASRAVGAREEKERVAELLGLF